MEMQTEGGGLEAAVETLGKEIEMKKREVDRSARKTLNRGVGIMHKRYLKQYLHRWKEVNRHHVKQQDGSEVILNKMRKRFLRQAFNKYKAYCSKVQVETRNEDSSASMKKTLDVKLMRKCFNAMTKFNGKN